MTRAVVRAVLVGQVKRLGTTVSAIDKHAVAGPVGLDAAGLRGDAQADRRVHGGPEKAVHCYAWGHYAAWRAQFPDCLRFQVPGAFGENLSIEGLDEAMVCVGDQWRIGSALCVVSQGRQPCFKLNIRFGIRDMARRVQDTLRAGWYLRVASPGFIRAGDGLELVARPHPAATIGRLLALIRDREMDVAILQEVLRLPLTAGWRRLFEQRLRTGRVEDWSPRMRGR